MKFLFPAVSALSAWWISSECLEGMRKKKKKVNDVFAFDFNETAFVSANVSLEQLTCCLNTLVQNISVVAIIPLVHYSE